MSKIKFKTHCIIGIISTLIILTLAVIASTPVFAEQVIVSDITKGNKIVFTPGRNVFYGLSGCSYNWSGLKRFNFDGFMQGDSSYKLTIRTTSTGRECQAIKTDVFDTKVNIPYVNVDAFNLSENPPIKSGIRVTFASSPSIGTPFQITDHPSEVGITNITSGTYGTVNYFRCEVVTSSITMDWLLSAGIESEITPGYVFSMTFFGGKKNCAGMRMTFDPTLLVKPNVPVIPEPVQCPVNCVP